MLHENSEGLSFATNPKPKGLPSHCMHTVLYLIRTYDEKIILILKNEQIYGKGRQLLIYKHYENHEKLISYFKLDHTFHLNKYGKWPGDKAIISQS